MIFLDKDPLENRVFASEGHLASKYASILQLLQLRNIVLTPHHSSPASKPHRFGLPVSLECNFQMTVFLTKKFELYAQTSPGDVKVRDTLMAILEELVSFLQSAPSVLYQNCRRGHGRTNHDRFVLFTGIPPSGRQPHCGALGRPPDNPWSKVNLWWDSFRRRDACRRT